MKLSVRCYCLQTEVMRSDRQIGVILRMCRAVDFRCAGAKTACRRI